MDWNDWILGREVFIRGTAFIGILLLMAAWEYRAPRRSLSLPRVTRWRSNLGLVALNALVLRLLFPIAATAAAVIAGRNGWGVLPLLQLGLPVASLLAIVLLDLAIYLQHVAFHALPFLWRLHRVHHADPDFDVTTGLRFHPGEIVLSMIYKFTVVLILGPPVIAVILFEVILNAASMFNHGNVTLAGPADRILRRLIVTPDMHRVHHSTDDRETNSNFGFCLSAWDRLFGTYRAQPGAGHTGMQIGLSRFTDPATTTSLKGLLLLPFTGGGTNRFGIRPRPQK